MYFVEKRCPNGRYQGIYNVCDDFYSAKDYCDNFQKKEGGDFYRWIVTEFHNTLIINDKATSYRPVVHEAEVAFDG